jgi:hypothetical protein
MFRGRLRLIGNAGSIVWGYRPAVVVGPWSIAKVEGQMVLRGRLTRVDPFSARQKPLLFTAPRAGGFWAFPVVDLQVGPGTFVARVEPPVH